MSWQRGNIRTISGARGKPGSPGPKGDKGDPGDLGNHESTYNHSNIHALGSDNQDLSGLQPKETGKSLSTNDYTNIEKTKLAGIESGANNYTHPSNHPPSIINQDANNRFITDTEKSIWDAKQDALGFTPVANNDSRLSDARFPLTHYHDYEPANINIQTHVISAHAPSEAQKNSDITKSEIEAKLTGVISTHSHAGGGGGLGYTINIQALTSSPVDAQTVYFGMLPKAPVTTANISKIYIRKPGTIKITEIYCYSGTAGTNQAWSLYIRKNNTTDYLIATLSIATNERIFSNITLSIPVIAGDYVEIKGVQPTWTTNPLTTIYGGYIYIE